MFTSCISLTRKLRVLQRQLSSNLWCNILRCTAIVDAKHVFRDSFNYKCWLISHRKTVQRDQTSPTHPHSPPQLPLSRFASSHHMAEVSQHSIPYWAKLRRSLCSLSLGFRGIDFLFSFILWADTVFHLCAACNKPWPRISSPIPPNVTKQKAKTDTQWTIRRGRRSQWGVTFTRLL